MVIALTRIQRHITAGFLAEGRRLQGRHCGNVVYRHRQGDQRAAAVVAVGAGHIEGSGRRHILRGGVQGGVALRVAIPRQRITARRRQRHCGRTAVGDILRHGSSGKHIEGACHRHAGRQTAFGVLDRCIAGDGRIFSNGLAHDVTGRTRGNDVGRGSRLIPVNGARCRGGREGQGSWSAMGRGHRRGGRGGRSGGFGHRHGSAAEASVQRARHRVGASGADRERGVSSGVIRPLVSGTDKIGFSRQRRAVARADDRSARDGYRRGGFQLKMVGRGHCRAAVGLRARHGIVTSGVGMQGVGGRGKRGAAPLPHIGAGTRSRESSLCAATFGCRARNGHRRITVDGHCGRGRIGAAVGAARQCNRLGADRVDLDRICIGASGPSIARSTTRLEGHSGTVSRSGIGAAVDGNRRQGFHIHKRGGRGRTAIGAGARHSVLGISCSRGGDVCRSTTTQTVAPHIGLST